MVEPHRINFDINLFTKTNDNKIYLDFNLNYDGNNYMSYQKYVIPFEEKEILALYSYLEKVTN